MRSRRLLIMGPSDEPMWVRLYVQVVGYRWAAMILAATTAPPAPGELKGTAFFADTAAEAERLALEYLGEGVSQN